ncbi:MAG TPA: peptidoglycan-binding domain-containing protein [Dactylosporangium sp.]|nr:peptidoglycan-binding domain-containing protein [Dactylosporangium sp.]
MKRKRGALVAGAAVAAVAGAGVAVVMNQHAPDTGKTTGADGPAATAAVVTTDVSRRQTQNGTLGRSGAYTVVAPAPGTLTWLPAVGAVVGRGKPAYEVDGAPVILLFGERPPWRAVQSGMTDGADVRQVEDNLKALGYGAGLTVDNHFSSATYWAIRRWQKDSGLAVTGTIPLGQIVFVAGTARIAVNDLRTGTAVNPGDIVEHATSEQRAITVQVSTNILPHVHTGDSVVVSLPDGTSKTGTVTTVGAVSSQQPTAAGGQNAGQNPNTPPTAAVVVTLTGDVPGIIEDAQVQVGFTVEAHKNVLAVPIPALRALPGAEYELLVADGGQSRHIKVAVGIFDQVSGLVEVRGDGLAADQRVVVPGDAS